MAKTYFNIPVDDEATYLAVKMIAKNNGFGERGMGMQIKSWVAQTRAVPVCDHPKTQVQVQRSRSETILTGMAENETELTYRGWYCPTCNRVYEDHQHVEDPYGQPRVQTVKKRRAISTKAVS